MQIINIDGISIVNCTLNKWPIYLAKNITVANSAEVSVGIVGNINIFVKVECFVHEHFFDSKKQISWIEYLSSKRAGMWDFVLFNTMYNDMG